MTARPEIHFRERRNAHVIEEKKPKKPNCRFTKGVARDQRPPFIFGARPRRRPKSMLSEIHRPRRPLNYGIEKRVTTQRGLEKLAVFR